MTRAITIDLIGDVLTRICEADKQSILTCAKYGISCEGWIKVRLLQELASLNMDVVLRPEWKNTDLVVSTADGDILLELKTFPTNYLRAGKPITNFISGVASDLQKLAAKRGPHDRGYSIWLAYFIPEPEPAQWKLHKGKVETVAAKTIMLKRIHLNENLFAYLYIMESK